MTLQQLKYVVTIVKMGTLSEAAKKLFISQPSLTKSVKELEKELGITIFMRTNKGVLLSNEGEEFLAYARQVLDQVVLIEEKYKGMVKRKQNFCVSTQHYSFAVNAFIELVQACDSERYDFSLRETQTYEIIEDVSQIKSEIGIIYYNTFNQAVLERLIKANNLIFTELFIAKPHVFMSRTNPLANQQSVTPEDLRDFPYLSFEQGEHNSFYFSEEIFSTVKRSKNIRVRDRATLFHLLVGLNGYTVCSGVIDEELNGKHIVAIPLEVAGEEMHIGILTRKGMRLSTLGEFYIEALKKYISYN